MTSAFATLAARGIYVEPTAIERVAGPGGEILQGPLARARQRGEHGRCPPRTRTPTTRVLQGVIDHGTGTAARLAGRPAAGKTGTAQHATDAWFCGYVPQLATCVWVGYPDGARPMRDVAGVPEVYGGTIPARIWHDFMTEATAGHAGGRVPAGELRGLRGPAAPPAPSPSAVPAGDVARPSSPDPSPEPSPSDEPSPTPTPSPEPSPSPSAGAGEPTERRRRSPRSRDP